jgi:hypothetical protein
MEQSISQMRGRIRNFGGQEACRDVSLAFILLALSLFSLFFNFLISFTKIAIKFGSDLL